MRGDGRVYKRGKIWWIGYWIDGEEIRESCGRDVTTKEGAKAYLKQIHQDINKGTYLPPIQRTVTVNTLLDDYFVQMANDGLASVRKAKGHAKPIREAFGRLPAASLTTTGVQRYQRDRLDAGKAPSTVNRGTDILYAALRRAANLTPPQLGRVPNIKRLKEDNARQGFTSRADFYPLLASIKDADVRDFVEWFWWTGMRPGEIRQLAWHMFDVETWTITLPRGIEKARKGRILAITGPLRTIIERRQKARRLDCPLIFHRVSAVHRDGKRYVLPGQPVRDFRRTWATALKAAHVAPGLIPYDLRRSALRNILRGGTHEKVVMAISGHRTRSTFDRYQITDTADIEAAINRTEAYVGTLPTARNVVAIENAQNPHNPAGARKAR